ncbi:MAG: SO_0444 family Cu/Zn efflux transporter [Phycisphaerae bacterium]|jgi:hypothetical protein|nr:SO_0444 family Cu/Zn efflux transporter [Phycisphaerae bacterium]
MLEQFVDIAAQFWSTIGEMAPFLLFGFLAAGVLSVLVSADWIQRHLGRGRIAPVIKASAFGVPLPLCSCSVIPVATSLRRHGASKGATTAFLISTPQTGVDSIFATFSLLGWMFAIFRPIAALISGVLGGGIVAVTGNSDHPGGDAELPECTDACCTAQGGGGKIVAALQYGLLVLPRDIGKALLIGLIAGALITVYIGDNNYFSQIVPPGPMQILVLMLVGIPLYICATASIPIAASLILAGVSPGAAFAMLMTGPATNAATIVTIWKVLGPRTCLIYLGTMMVSAFVGGMLLDQLINLGDMQQMMMHHHGVLPWWKHASAVALIGILGVGTFWRPDRKADQPPQDAQGGLQLQVTGMTCSHCTSSVRSALLACTGVSEVSIDLKAQTAHISGDNLQPDELISAVEKAGYTASRAGLV